MSNYKSLFKQTLIYGIATVLPRVISFLLVGLHTKAMPKPEMYGEVTLLLSYMVFFNVVLSYGMETAFFRFFHKEEKDKDIVSSTSLVSLFWSSILFLCLALLMQKTISGWLNVPKEFFNYAVWILVLDALVIIPFSQLRAQQKSIQYAIIKIGNVLINISFNFFFLVLLPSLHSKNPSGFWSSFYIPEYQVGYVFISILLASLTTFLFFIPNYLKSNWCFDTQLWKKMMQYGWPILFAGLAFGINEHFDKILLEKLLPESIAKKDLGAYAACYKLGLFMVLYRTAYTLGIEPFFFSQANKENAKQIYATVTKYFVIFGSFMMLAIIVFADVIKYFLIRNSSYDAAMVIVPLIIFANFFLGIYTSLSVWYKLIDKTIIGAYISVVGAVITLLLNFMLIPKISYVGSAIATIAAYGSMMIISYWLGTKRYPIPFEIKKIVGYLFVSIVLSSLSFYIKIFRETYVFGIFALIGFGYYIYKTEKNSILKVIKKK